MYGKVFGENLSIDRNEVLAQKHLYDSPGHFQNIVNPLFQEVGIGITV
ncbi:MAG: hypothetical protein U9Q15_04675 [Patescibacteria group bacterium]|nr:hypothetical protein [Patescibacteria group bacterium]